MASVFFVMNYSHTRISVILVIRNVSSEENVGILKLFSHFSAPFMSLFSLLLSNSVLNGKGIVYSCTSHGEITLK